MYTVLSILIIIVSILLLLIVLVQKSKGGGLASNFAGSNQIMGVRKTTDFLEKATWIFAITLIVFSILASMTIPRAESNQNKSVIEKQIQEAADPTAMPNFPTAAPPQQQAPGQQPTK
ncbi:MAG TPA: preprotein translocase subunit SecG [Bacteroidales bacterium]|nr:preprotein translocase subunit SecG [Bacteroidales bacterium]